MPGVLPALMPFLASALALAAGAARAQGEGCEQFKAQMAARIEGRGIRGYSLEYVPGNAPVPSGASVFGTCEGGAWKLVYRRFGGPPLTDGAAAPSPAPRPPPSPSPTPSPTPSIATPPAPAARPAAAAAPAKPAPPQAAKPVPPAMPAPPAPAAAPAPAPPPEPDRAASTPAPDQDRPAAATTPARPASGSAQSEDGFVTPPLLWLALLGAPLIVALGAWITYRRHYDAAGLPRGPRL